MSRYNRIRKYIASRHDQFVVRSGEKFCRIFLDCVDNARHWSFETNGEGLIAQFIVRSCDGDILDVGAHTGEYALLIGQIDPVRAIHLFEPIPHFAAKAAAFCSGLPNVHIHNLGLSNSSRTQKMYVSRRYPSTSGATEFLHDFDRNAVFDEFDCRFERGDQFLSQNNIAKVALLKLDVEGMEKQALQGFGHKLDSSTIEVIQFEHGPVHAETGDTLRTFRRFFDERGFDVFAIYPNGLREPSNAGVNSETFRGRNFLAVGRQSLHKFRDLIVGAC